MKTDYLIIVAGKAASGKSTLSRALTERGFSVVSASQVLRQTFFDRHTFPDRHSLATLGRTARSKPEFERFHRALNYEIRIRGSCVVLDGPRFKETVDAVRQSATSTIVIYLDCPDTIRRDRLLSTGRAAEWSWLNQHPTELSVEDIRESADLIIDGRQASHHLATLIVDYLPGLNS